MLRIHFTPADVGRVQITGPNVMAELVTTARNLVNGHPDTAVARGVSSTARPLLQLLERPDACPDFLTPGGELGVRSAFHAVLATPAGRVREELADYNHHAWTRDPGTVRQRLAPAMHAYYDLAFRSQWPALSSRASRDQVTRMRMAAAGGLDDLFAHLHSMISWRSPTLSAVCEYDLDMYLDGRGLRLVPVASLTRPGVIDRPGAPLEIHYPAQASDTPVRRVDALGPLLGRTRASILASVGAGATTSQLATRVGVSLPSASEHATVLRNAGLITSERVGGAVVHTLTPLGSVLLGPVTRRGRKPPVIVRPGWQTGLRDT